MVGDQLGDAAGGLLSQPLHSRLHILFHPIPGNCVILSMRTAYTCFFFFTYILPNFLTFYHISLFFLVLSFSFFFICSFSPLVCSVSTFKFQHLMVPSFFKNDLVCYVLSIFIYVRRMFYICIIIFNIHDVYREVMPYK